MQPKKLNYYALNRLLSLKSTRFAIMPVSGNGYVAAIYKSQDGVLIGAIRFENQNYCPSQMILVQFFFNTDIEALILSGSPAGVDIANCMQAEAMLQGESLESVRSWQSDARANQKQANMLARTVGCKSATEIVFGNEDRVVSYATSGYRIIATEEFASMLVRNTIGWNKTYYRYSECKVQLRNKRWESSFV